LNCPVTDNYFETFEKCPILPAQLNPFLLFNRGSRPTSGANHSQYPCIHEKEK
jgi:hypothetical protein